MGHAAGTALRALILVLSACATRGAPAPVDLVAEQPLAPVTQGRAMSWYLRGRVAEGIGDEAMALRGMSWTARLAPREVGLGLLRADWAKRRGDTEQALATCLDLVDALETEVACEVRDVHACAAEAWLELGHPGDARRRLAGLAACPVPELELRVAFAEGDRAGATAWLERWRPTSVGERADAASWAIRLDRAEQALTWLGPWVGHPGHEELIPVVEEVAARWPEPTTRLVSATASSTGWQALARRLEAP